MNQLNSLILEGTVTKDAVYEDEKASFSISVSRFYKDTNGEAGETKSYFNVEAGGVFAEKVHDKLVKDRGVRIVGQLRSKQVEDKHVAYILAEHIELRPARNLKEED